MSKIQIRSVVISACLSFLTSLLSFYYATYISEVELFSAKWLFQVFVIPVLFFIGAYWILMFPFIPAFGAYWSQFTDGKMRGFWRDTQLDNQIINLYKSSTEIKIKVTRAYNLFVNPQNTNFYTCINDNSQFDRHRTIKLLMHYPCLKSKHVRRRANTYHLRPEDFIKTWFDVLETLLVNISASRLINATVEVRFYASRHDRWRFYIFQGKREIMLANYYDDNCSGYKLPMYKILYSYESLQKYFSVYFDEIWNNESESMNAYDFVADHFSLTNNQLTTCVGCEFGDSCSRLRHDNIDRIRRVAYSPDQ